MNTSVEARFAPNAVRRDVSLRAWVARCAAAEAIGMSAAAAAARYTDHVLIDRTTLTIVLAGACILIAGLVEGTALGIAQAGAMRRLTPDLPVGRYVMVTVAMAGVGWAAGSVPSLTADPSASSSAPAWPLMLLLGGLMGATMGGLLGVAQSLVLRKHTHARLALGGRQPGRLDAGNGDPHGRGQPSVAALVSSRGARLGAGCWRACGGHPWPHPGLVLVLAARGQAPRPNGARGPAVGAPRTSHPFRCRPAPYREAHTSLA